MKNIFALEKKTLKYDGAQFIARTISECDSEIVRRQEKQAEDEKNLEKIAALPPWLQWVGYVLLLAGMCVVAGTLNAFTDGDLSFAEAFDNAGWLMISGAVALVIGAAIALIAFLRRKKVVAGSAYRYTQENAQKLLHETYASLGVPEGADEIEVIGVVYKSKNGGCWNKNPFFSNMLYVHTAVFIEDDCLCFATAEEVFKIPLSRISKIQTEKKRIFAMGWKDDVPFNKGRYKQYKLLSNNAGMVGGKPTYKLMFRDDNYEDCYVLIPCFDIEPVLKLTGKIAE